MILTNDEALAKKINSAVFPGMQGGPLMHIIAAKAVAFGEALQPEFKAYARAVVENAKALGEVLSAAGYDLVAGGTDTHLLLVDLRPKKLTGNVAEKALGRAHITTNKNGVPFDPEKPPVTSGIRIGSPAGTTRGFGIAEFRHDRPPHGRGARRPGGERRSRQRQDRSEGEGRGDRAHPPLPDICVNSALIPILLRMGRGSGRGQPHAPAASAVTPTLAR